MKGERLKNTVGKKEKLFRKKGGKCFKSKTTFSVYKLLRNGD